MMLFYDVVFRHLLLYHITLYVCLLVLSYSICFQHIPHVTYGVHE